MLIRFSVENFRSFGENGMTLNMVSSSKIQRHRNHICKTDLPIKILRDAVVYGANSAGKSNLVKALFFFVETVREGTLPSGISKEFCRTSEENANRESVFDIQIEVDGQCFDYGFSCRMKEAVITSEWLYLLEKGAEAERLFERDVEGGIRLFVEGSEEEQMRFNVYRDDFVDSVGLISRALFLSTLNQGRSFEENSSFGFFSRVFKWFKSNVRVFGAGMPNPEWNFYLRSSLDDVGELLASFDTGVTGLEKVVVPVDELANHIPPALVAELKHALEQAKAPDEKGKVGMTVRTNDSFVGIDKDANGEISATMMKIHHGGSPFEYDYGDESEGTKRLFDFVDLILGSKEDVTYVVDELSLSLHPLLTQHIIELFNETHKDDGCQLVFTTHENDIMSFDYFRRDEIWFVERNDRGESILYPLDKFADTVRSDTRTNKSYMEGRYGGIPVLSLDRSLAAIES